MFSGATVTVLQFFFLPSWSKLSAPQQAGQSYHIVQWIQQVFRDWALAKDFSGTKHMWWPGQKKILTKILKSILSIFFFGPFWAENNWTEQIKKIETNRNSILVYCDTPSMYEFMYVKYVCMLRIYVCMYVTYVCMYVCYVHAYIWKVMTIS